MGWHRDMNGELYPVPVLRFAWQETNGVGLWGDSPALFFLPEQSCVALNRECDVLQLDRDGRRLVAGVGFINTRVN